MSASTGGPSITFRKKPVEVEARQYTLTDRASVAAWCGAQTTGFDNDGAEYELRNIIIHTLEGDHYARPGDWIIRGVQGEFYPCKPDIFAATYDPVAKPSTGGGGDRVLVAAKALRLAETGSASATLGRFKFAAKAIVDALDAERSGGDRDLWILERWGDEGHIQAVSGPMIGAGERVEVVRHGASADRSSETLDGLALGRMWQAAFEEYGDFVSPTPDDDREHTTKRVDHDHARRKAAWDSVAAQIMPERGSESELREALGTDAVEIVRRALTDGTVRFSPPDFGGDRREAAQYVVAKLNAAAVPSPVEGRTETHVPVADHDRILSQRDRLVHEIDVLGGDGLAVLRAHARPVEDGEG